MSYFSNLRLQYRDNQENPEKSGNSAGKHT